MKLTVSNIDDLHRAVAEGERSDYVYMYPPRQAYGPLDHDRDHLAGLVTQSLASRSTVNLYVHVPFCNQLCGFCNLYTTTIKSEDAHRRYIEAVCRQIASFDLVDRAKQVTTVYVGGGTPSLLPADLLAQLLGALRDRFPAWSATCEVAIEVDPNTVDRHALEQLRSVGFNRVNLGLQSRQQSEILTIGRRVRSADQRSIAEVATEIGFENVCVDLIYGLPGQTVASFLDSVEDCTRISPETICCYPLTRRPFTGFDRRHVAFDAFDSHEAWRRADQILTQAGYWRESHVRWARPGGGYKQKELHWGMENVLGFGAGARSYLWDVDLRWGYSITDRNATLDAYLAEMDAGVQVPHEGYLMTPDERMRKGLVLGLGSTDLDRLGERVGQDLPPEVRRYVDDLAAAGFVCWDGSVPRLTDLGALHRDLLVQPFFSDAVRARLDVFDYAE